MLTITPTGKLCSVLMAMTPRITDLIGRHFDKIVIVLLSAGLFFYASIKQTFRLRGEVPTQFIDTTSSSEDQPGAVKTARAYWDCAVVHIQWKYGYGYPLPAEPPPEFTLTKGDYDSVASDPVTRARYWHKLQVVWPIPSTWRKTYAWDFNWITDWIEPTQDWLNRHLPGLGNG